MRDLVRISEPSALPVSAADLRAHLRLDSTAQDSYIETIIAAAVRNIEETSNRALITQTWRLSLPRFWSECIELPYAPLQTVETIEYITPAGDTEELDASLYTVFADTLVGRIHTAHGASLPSVRSGPGAVVIEYEAGYGDAAANVPADVKHAVKLLSAHWFMHAEPVVSGPGSGVNAVPDTLMRLIQAFTARGIA